VKKPLLSDIEASFPSFEASKRKEKKDGGAFSSSSNCSSSVGMLFMALLPRMWEMRGAES